MIRTVSRGFSPSETGREGGLDIRLIAAASTLLFFGLASLYSIDYSRDTGWFSKQLFLAVLGVVPFFLFLKVPSEFWHRAATPLYIFNLILLLAVQFVGSSSGGAQRWLDLKVIQFQPSEFSKVALALTLAAFYANRAEDMRKPSTFLLGLLHLLPPLLLVFKQPHLGGTLTLMAVWFAVTVVAGVPWRFLGVFAIVASVLAFGAWKAPNVLTDEQRSRVLGFIYPDPKGDGYQQTRALVALGSGGAFGTGYLKGELKAAGSVPEQQTDFVFSVIGEEGGLFGLSLMMAAFGYFFYRGWSSTLRAESYFKRLASVGILAALAFHFVANVGMNLMMLPVVGLWLPFVSYGGTALWMCMAAVGFFASDR